MKDLSNRIYVVTGIASDRSIAYGIAQSLALRGAQCILTYQSERFAERLQNYAKELNALGVIECDFSTPNADIRLQQKIQEMTSVVHGAVHAIAYADPSQLQGKFIDVVERDHFLKAHDVSSYSLCVLTKALRTLLVPQDSAIVALTYIGAIRFVPHYNVMGLAKASLEANVRYLAGDLGEEGIRVNGLSCGPIRTLAASGIKGLKEQIQEVAQKSLLKKSVTIEEVGEVAAFLLSPSSKIITGQIIYADAGFSASALF